MISYNPHSVSRNERLAYPIGKQKNLWLVSKRRFRNSALLPHELILRSPKIARVTIVAKQYHDDSVTKVLAE